VNQVGTHMFRKDGIARSDVDGQPAQTLILPDDVHNRALVHNVHPPTWVNPTPTGRYNLVVLGAGTAGLVSAVGAAGLGAKVALIEKYLMGGDCLNFGCVPSKGLLRAARAVQAVREADAFGVRTADSVGLDFAAAMERMRRLRAGISHNDSAHRLAKLGVDVFLGEAKFVGRDAVEVGGQTLHFSRAVIATGARAASPPIPGLVGVGFLTNETVFSLTALPRRLIVIGAGPVGCELAQAFCRFGGDISLLSHGSHLLPREDADATAILAAQFEREGIHIALGANIRRAERQNDAKALVFEREGREQTVVADEILVAVGRAPNVEGLNLEAAEVAFDKTGVKVDDHLRTSNPRIYAAGDICSVYKFTHAADAMARTALQNALFFGRKKASALVIPWCTYTDPEVAHVGLYEKEARDQGLDVATLTVSINEVDRAVLDGDDEGFARIHAQKKSGRILGASLVARHAGETIGEISLAITAGVRLGSIAKTIHPYPTQAEVWKRLGDAWNRSRLTPRVRSLFERYLSWRR
jgi:pyruvate/2-oxoglutarate dehydrogenase complex dihydrolipoamide dehydrogenase (E3) component